MTKKLIKASYSVIKKIPIEYQTMIGIVIAIISMLAIFKLGDDILWIVGTIAFVFSWIVQRVLLSQAKIPFVIPKWTGEVSWWISACAFIVTIASYHIEDIFYPILIALMTCACGMPFLIYAKKKSVSSKSDKST